MTKPPKPGRKPITDIEKKRLGSKYIPGGGYKKGGKVKGKRKKKK